MAMVDVPDRSPDLLRVRLLVGVICLGLLAIAGRLWYLQVVHGDELEQAALNNLRRLIRRVPPRGQITDRAGRVLATNRHQMVVSVVPDEVLPGKKKRSPVVLYHLASLLKMPPELLAAIIRKKKLNAFDLVRVAEDVDMETVTRIEEQRLKLPGVFVGPEPVRYYPDGALCGHLLGQMGQIPPEELEKRREEGYRPGDFCGRLGLERAFDRELRGRDGGRKIEVNARGRMLREIANEEPVPGATLALTLDRDVQKTAYDALTAIASRPGNPCPGAAVALDPQTGAVLALVSVPSYDPNQFVQGITVQDMKRLRDNPLLPQINRAVGSAYAPGSTFKVITATAGLDTGKATLYRRDYCSGAIRVGRRLKRCHRRGGHGSLDLIGAIARSCDVYFYHLGQDLQPDTMAAYARRYGLGRRTGIDLPLVETAGIVPTPAWKKAKWGQEWYGGETVDYAIGQAMLGCTPLQMCNATAAIANGGTLFRPQLVQTITAYDPASRPTMTHRLKPEVAGRLGVSAGTLAAIQQGMRAVMLPGGTAHSSTLPGVTMAGKTGTAEMMRHGQMVNNAWFIGYAPAERPRIAVCVFIEGGGHGGETAAPIARAMIARYLHLRLNGTLVSSGRSDD